MTEYQKAKRIRQYITQRAAEVMNYESWSDEFSTENIRNIPQKILENIGTVDVTSLTDEEMEDLGFTKWSQDNPMRLIPLWLFPFLPEEIHIQNFDGSKQILKKSEMDKDHRFGCLAYGIPPLGSVNLA